MIFSGMIQSYGNININADAKKGVFMTQGLVSVIIPTFNDEKTISVVLDSVLNQTRFDLIKEIFVINDGSTDQTETVLNFYINEHTTDKIKIITKINEGVARARNEGIKKATGKYLAFLDADDYWFPQKIERQISIMERNKKISFLGTDYSSAQFPIGKKYKPGNEIYNLTLRELLLRSYPMTPTVVIRKSLQERIGFFPENMEYSEDINFFQRCAAKFNNYYILPENLVYIGIQKNQQYSSGLSSHMIAMHKGSLKNLIDLKEEGYIKNLTFIFFYLFYQIKFLRRIAIMIFDKIWRKKISL